jgi:hypothetical protein
MSRLRVTFGLLVGLGTISGACDRRTPEELGKDYASLYAIFSKAFRGALELRAKNAEGQEVGRSERLAKLEQSADSARFFTFKFDARTPLASVTEFTLHSVTPRR